MTQYTTFDSPIGELLAVSDDESLIRLDMRGGRRPVHQGQSLMPARQHRVHVIDTETDWTMFVKSPRRTALVGGIVLAVLAWGMPTLAGATPVAHFHRARPNLGKPVPGLLGRAGPFPG